MTDKNKISPLETDCRDDFDDWRGCLDNKNGNATRHEIAIAWRAWQAARGVKFTPYE